MRFHLTTSPLYSHHALSCHRAYALDRDDLRKSSLFQWAHRAECLVAIYIYQTLRPCTHVARRPHWSSSLAQFQQLQVQTTTAAQGLKHRN